jgi:hypothetical protein
VSWWSARGYSSSSSCFSLSLAPGGCARNDDGGRCAHDEVSCAGRHDTRLTQEHTPTQARKQPAPTNGTGCSIANRATQPTVYAYGKVATSSELKVLLLNVSRVRNPETDVPFVFVGEMATVMVALCPGLSTSGL